MVKTCGKAATPSSPSSHSTPPGGEQDRGERGVPAAEAAAGLTAVGVVVAAQGVKGLVRVKTFTETPETLDAYGPLTDAAGVARFEVKVVEARQEVAIARVAGVADRAAAERMKGRMFYLRRDALPEPEADEFLHADLIGLSAETEGEGRIGQVAALYEYGAGDLIEIELDAGGPPLVLPFTLAAAPEIDLAAGRIRLTPPAGLWPRELSASEKRRRKSASEP